MEYLSVEVAVPAGLRDSNSDLCPWRDDHLVVSRSKHELGYREIYSGFDDRAAVDRFVDRTRESLTGLRDRTDCVGQPFVIRSLNGSQMNRIVREVFGTVGENSGSI